MRENNRNFRYSPDFCLLTPDFWNSMLVNMIHDNHGEPPFKTRYRDPRTLAAYGYQAIVIPEALAAIPSAYEQSNFKHAPTQNVPHPLKPQDIEKTIDAQVKAAADANVQVFFYADALLLPRSIVMRRQAEFLCDDPTGRLCPAKPAVLEALQDQINELFDRWPTAEGLVMRTGEVYPEATPHMVGSPLHTANCPACRNLSQHDRLVRFITAMHDVVIKDRQKTYVHRTWQPPTAVKIANIHDDPDTYRALSKAVPESPNLHFSFKFTRGDFHAGQPFNSCILADDSPKWIEFQCEREYEGKGAFPNYQAPLWQKFIEHLAAANPELSCDNLRDRFTLWGWSRGGGWGGPYVQREEWIDANVHALAHLHQSCHTPTSDLATAWAGTSFQIAESSPPAPAITELLLMSAPTIQKLLHPLSDSPIESAPWVHDDLLDVNALWEAATQVVEAGQSDAACAEKSDALAAVDRIRQLFDLASPELPNKSQARDLANSLAYFSSFAGAVAHLFTGFVRFAQWTRTGRTDSAIATSAAESLKRAQSNWQQHTQRHAMLPGAPTVFRENTLWQRTNDCLEQLAG
jgi:hypothetical protein